MKNSSKLLKAVSALLFIASLFSCVSMPSAPAGPAPGTVGFYDIDPVEGRVQTEDLEARRMSSALDRIFVYRVDNDKVIIGHNKIGDLKVKPLDQISTGVVITNDGANQLAAFLERIVAEYNGGDKTNSKYLDFRFLENGTVEVADVELPVEVETIALRFQYVFNNTDVLDEEITLCYLGGGGKAELITLIDVQALLANLQKN